MQQNDPRLEVIILSFKDPRVLNAIESVKQFDDLGIVSLLIIDGGSDGELVSRIEAAVGEQGRVISERDNGIFDGLNKGLNLVTAEFIGWLGSDDFYAPDFKVSQLLPHLEKNDIVVGNLAHFSGGKISRISYSWPAGKGLVKWGFNNPHFSTFGKAALLKAHSFKEDSPVSDIEYFLRVFEQAVSVKAIPRIFVYAEEGGFSNSSPMKIIKLNLILAHIYSRFLPKGLFIICLKVIYKLVTKFTCIRGCVPV
ncbi:MAG: glycosyltransferase [Verrucomicrobiales bacterium]|nr:glycosyltransferase [Verrucomicrobiales bacterium]